MENKKSNSKKIYLIENSERLSNLLKSLVIQHGFETTIKFTGLDAASLAKKIGEYNNYTAYDYYTIIQELFKKNKLENSIGNYHLYFDNFGGTLNWDYRGKNDDMHSLCTPFWEDDFIIPIDVNDYYNGNELIEIHEYVSIKITQRPETIEEIISWFNNFYLNAVKHKLDEFLIKLRHLY